MVALASVRVENIQMMVIGEICYESKPCVHTCTIRLQDGREKTVEYLSALKIDALIQNIALKYLTSDYNAQHFSKQRQGELEDAETILNEIFPNDD